MEKDNKWRPVEGSHQNRDSGHEYQGSILEHILLEHLTQFYDVGRHNHMRLRGADWNDALDMAKERVKVLLSLQYTEQYDAVGRTYINP